MGGILGQEGERNPSLAVLSVLAHRDADTPVIVDTPADEVEGGHVRDEEAGVKYENQGVSVVERGEGEEGREEDDKEGNAEDEEGDKVVYHKAFEVEVVVGAVKA